MNSRSFEGKIVLVTGGNGGIGLAMATAFAEQGATVVIVGRNSAKGRAAQAELQKLSPSSVFISADIAIEHEVREAFAKVIALFGNINALINNAAISIPEAAETLSLATLRHVGAVNLEAALLFAQLAYPFFLKNKGGRIVNVSSIGGVRILPLSTAYCVSKAGLIQLTKAMAAEWGQHGITVNTLIPGWIETEFSEPAKLFMPTFEEMVIQRTPVKRWGVPEDFGKLALFLCGEHSSFVNGTEIVVDGGYGVNLV